MEFVFAIVVLVVALATIFFVMAEPGMKKATTFEPHGAHHEPAVEPPALAVPALATEAVQQPVVAAPPASGSVEERRPVEESALVEESSLIEAPTARRAIVTSPEEPVAVAEPELPGAALGDLEHVSSVEERSRWGDAAHGAGEGSRAAEPVPYVSANFDPAAGARLSAGLASAAAGLAGVAAVSAEPEVPVEPDVLTEPEPVAEMLAEGGVAPVVEPPVVEEPVAEPVAEPEAEAELPGAALGDLEHVSSVEERSRWGDAAHGAGEGSRAAEPVPYVSADFDPAAAVADPEAEVPAEPDVVTEPEPVAEMLAEGGVAPVVEPSAIESADEPEELAPVPEAPELLSGPERVEIPAPVIPAPQYETEPEPLPRPAEPEVSEQPESVADYLASLEGEEEVEQVWDGPFGPGSAEAGPNGEGPRGWTVKAARQTKVYLTPDIPVFAAARANVWFIDEQRAVDAGFRRWDMPHK